MIEETLCPLEAFFKFMDLATMKVAEFLHSRSITAAKGKCMRQFWQYDPGDEFEWIQLIVSPSRLRSAFLLKKVRQ